MFTTILLKELRYNILSSKFVICYCAVFVLIVLSVVSRGYQYKEDLAAYHREYAKFEKDLRNGSNLEQTTAYFVTVPPAKLRIFAGGFDRFVARPFKAGAEYMTWLGQHVGENPIFVQYKVYDLGLIAAMILSLLAIIIGYDGFSGEAERRTLNLVLANPVPRGLLILGKLAGGFITLAVPMLIAYVFSLLLLMILLGITFNGGEWIRLFFMFGLMCLLGSLFYLMTSLLSIFFRRSIPALAASITFWIVLVIVVPNFAYPVLDGLFNQVDTSDMGVRLSNIRKEEQQKTLTRLKSVPKGPLDHLEWVKNNDYIKRRTAGVIAEYRNAMLKNARRGMMAARVSPVNSFMFGFTHLAGTGLEDLVHFKTWQRELSLANYTIAKKTEMDRVYEHRDKPLAEALKYCWPVPIDTDILPDRVYRRAGAEVHLRNAGIDIVVLLLGNLILFMGAFILFIKRF